MLIINPRDNVGVVLEDVIKENTLNYKNIEVVAKENIEFAHKVALKDFAVGEVILKYGESIGYALKEIKRGEWIHIHNMDCERAREGRLV